MLQEMQSHRWHFKFLLIISLPAVLWLFTNASVNMHVHRLSDGTYISHSHPYNKQNPVRGIATGHHHSEKQYQLLQVMSIPATIVVLTIVFFFYLQLEHSGLKFNVIKLKAKREHYGILSYRGPPPF